MGRRSQEVPSEPRPPRMIVNGISLGALVLLLVWIPFSRLH